MICPKCDKPMKEWLGPGGWVCPPCDKREKKVDAILLCVEILFLPVIIIAVLGWVTWEIGKELFGRKS